jgi:hypothetical protein
MTNFLEDAEARSIDDIALEDTIEMVLTESAFQSLSQAAAPTEEPRASAKPVLKEAEVPEGNGLAGATARAEAKGPAAMQAHEAAKAPESETAPAGAAALAEAKASDQAKVAADAKVPAVVQAPDQAKAPASVHALAEPKAPEPARSERRPPMSTLRFAILLGVVAAASALATVFTYFATTHTEQPPPIATTIVFSPPAPVIVAPPALPPSPSPPPQEDPAPVRFANPFDRNEVFEFPAGTSRADARDAVEELLYERAQERQSSGRGLVSGMTVKHTTNATAAAAPAARKAAP